MCTYFWALCNLKDMISILSCLRGELPVTPREEDGKGGAKPAVPHTKNMKRALTGHVVTRW